MVEQVDSDGENVLRDMITPVAESDLNDELKRLTQASSLVAAPLRAPFEVLSDREFELLLFCLFRDGQNGKANENCGITHDATRLMQGVSEKGRDVVLMRNDLPVGVVQCKHYQSSLSLPEALREICRFILAAKLQPALMPTPENFTYVMAVSSKVTENASDFFYGRLQLVDANPEQLLDAVNAVIDKYKGLKDLDPQQSVAHIKEVLSKIQLKLLDGTTLGIWLNGCDRVLSAFFQTRMVVDNAEVVTRLQTIEDAMSKVISAESLNQQREASALAVAVAVDNNGVRRPISLSDLYVERSIEAEVDKWIEKADVESGTGVLIWVVAPAGFGKTSLLWNSHRRWGARADTATLSCAAPQLANLIKSGRFDDVRRGLLLHAQQLSSQGHRFVFYLAGC